MARRRTVGADGPATVDEAVAFEGIGGDDPTPARRGPGRPRKMAGAAPRKIAARTAAGHPKSKTAMIDEVRTQIEFFLILGQGLWATKDPCAGAATPERIESLADGMTELIARNPRLLAYAASSGILGSLVKIGGAVLPIVATVVRAHGPGGHGHEQESNPDDVNDKFPAFAG